MPSYSIEFKNYNNSDLSNQSNLSTQYNQYNQSNEHNESWEHVKSNQFKEFCKNLITAINQKNLGHLLKLSNQACDQSHQSNHPD